MPRYVLINGAPRSGKDTIAQHLWKLNYPTMRLERFSMPHKQAFAAMMNVDCNGFGIVQNYESRKDEPLAELNGASFRQWQIDFSEKFMKPYYGMDIFGRLLLSRTSHWSGSVVVPDCGFQIEIDVLADQPCLLISVKREGTNYDQDSRSDVLPAPGWSHVTIHNNGTVEDLHANADRAFTVWRESLLPC